MSDVTVTDERRMGINWIGLGTIIRREWSRVWRVPIQAFLAPWISALMFIFIFGYVVGGNIRHIAGHSYVEFVLPGVLMLNIVNAAFIQASTAIYFSRFIKVVEEMLVAPLSYVEMIIGSLSVVVLRATVTGIGILLMGIGFGATHIESWPMFLFWIVSVSTVFGLLGLIVGLWSKSFEQLNMPVVFLLTPLDTPQHQFNAKCDPEKAEELREKYPDVKPGYHMNKKHWNTVVLDGRATAVQVREWIDHSFALVAKTKK